MDLRAALKQYLALGNELFPRLRSAEASTLTKTELQTLRVQLYILDAETRVLEQQQNKSEMAGPSQTEHS
jgi:hypothetical protein